MAYFWLIAMNWSDLNQTRRNLTMEQARYLDSSAVALDTLLLLISLLLNPLVLCFYRVKEVNRTRNMKFQLAGRLYQYLALSDLLTSIIYLPPVISNIGSPTLQYYVHFKNFNSSYYEYQGIPYGLTTVSFFGDRLMFLSAVITTLLVVTRFIKIIRPFCHIKLSYIHVYLVIIALVSTGRMLYLYINNRVVWSGCSQLYLDENLFLIEKNASYWTVFGKYQSVIAAEFMANLPFYLHCLSSCFFSLATLFTLCKLRRHPGITADKLLGMKPILLLNCGVGVHSILIAVHAALFRTMSLRTSCLFSFLTRSVIPCLLSSYNPVVLIICNADIRNFAKKVFIVTKTTFTRQIHKLCRRVLVMLRCEDKTDLQQNELTITGPVQQREVEDRIPPNILLHTLSVPQYHYVTTTTSSITDTILWNEQSRNDGDPLGGNIPNEK